MAERVSVLGKLSFEESGDSRAYTESLSDKLVSELAHHRFQLLTNSSTEVGLGEIASDTGTKAFLFKADQPCSVIFNTSTGSSFPDVPGGGFLSGCLTNVTHVWVSNLSTTTVADVILNIASYS